MKKLIEIMEEVGDRRFTLWVSEAWVKMKREGYDKRSADAKHAFIYEEMIRHYETYKEGTNGK